MDAAPVLVTFAAILVLALVILYLSVRVVAQYERRSEEHTSELSHT